jgi:AraC-like DNA-binding protein
MLSGMEYKHVVYKDALRHEGIWLCTSHSHELLVQNPQAPNYLMTTNISQDYSYPLLVLFAGTARWFAGQSLRFVSQPGMFGIEYIRSGDALIKKDGREILVQTGEVYFLSEHSPDEYSTGPSGSLSKRYIMLTGAAHEYLLRLLNLWERQTMRVRAPRQFEALMRRMTRLMTEHPPDIGLQASTLAYQILLALSQSIQPTRPQIVKHALAFMQKNLQQPVKLGDLCEHLGVSEAFLGRQFARYLHTSPIKYFLKQKLTWSANMLCSTSLTIKEIAYNAGYEDPFYFSKQFKMEFGMSPSEYRKTHPLGIKKE